MGQAAWVLAGPSGSGSGMRARVTSRPRACHVPDGAWPRAGSLRAARASDQPGPAALHILLLALRCSLWPPSPGADRKRAEQGDGAAAWHLRAGSRPA
jgi:hypothetical protein